MSTPALPELKIISYGPRFEMFQIVDLCYRQLKFDKQALHFVSRDGKLVFWQAFDQPPNLTSTTRQNKVILLKRQKKSSCWAELHLRIPATNRLKKRQFHP